MKWKVLSCGDGFHQVTLSWSQTGMATHSEYKHLKGPFRRKTPSEIKRDSDRKKQLIATKKIEYDQANIMNTNVQS